MDVMGCRYNRPKHKNLFADELLLFLGKWSFTPGRLFHLVGRVCCKFSVPGYAHLPKGILRHELVANCESRRASMGVYHLLPIHA